MFAGRCGSSDDLVSPRLLTPWRDSGIWLAMVQRPQHGDIGVERESRAPQRSRSASGLRAASVRVAVRPWVASG
jgi:hypothetical protein